MNHTFAQNDCNILHSLWAVSNSRSRPTSWSAAEDQESQNPIQPVANSQCVMGPNPLTLMTPRSQVFLSPPHSKASNSPFAFVSDMVR